MKMAEAAAEGEQSTGLTRKKNAKSVVWDYFGIRVGEDGLPVPGEEQKPVCRSCGKVVLAKGGNTTNLLLTHLRDHHPQLHVEATRVLSRNPVVAEAGKKCQASLDEVVEKSRRYEPKSPRTLELNRAVLYHLAKDMQPLYTVEKPGFRKLLATLDSKYQLPSRRHFAEQELPRLYTEVREKHVMPKLSKLTFFSATTDLWTSAAKHPYLSLTVHFISDEWSLETVCLDTAPLFMDNTGQNLAEAFQDISVNWNLSQDKLVFTTTDNGSNFISAFDLLELPRLSYFGHNLYLRSNQ